jgi:two-component system NarL family sensor kinase
LTASLENRSARLARSRKLKLLRARLAEAEGTLGAIRKGEVDVVLVPGKLGDRVFTLDGAERAYRILIESVNEGALTLTPDGTILYANRCFAGMSGKPLERVVGSALHGHVSAKDRARLRSFLKRTGKTGGKIQLSLEAGDGSQMPVQVSASHLARNGANRAAICMVVTDLREARRTEELLRALTHRVVQAQEAERGRVALELHDNITQSLCAVVFRSQALVASLSGRDGASKEEAIRLRNMLGETAEEVERISRHLRPGALEQLGLAAVLRDATAEFALRTGVSTKLTCAGPAGRLPADTELALYRIFQEALRNVESHARARRVTVRLEKLGGVVRLLVNDDGVGFDPDKRPLGRRGRGALGLLGMQERAVYAGGTFRINSVRPTGTEVDVRIPVPVRSAAAN